MLLMLGLLGSWAAYADEPYLAEQHVPNYLQNKKLKGQVLLFPKMRYYAKAKVIGPDVKQTRALYKSLKRHGIQLTDEKDIIIAFQSVVEAIYETCNEHLIEQRGSCAVKNATGISAISSWFQETPETVFDLDALNTKLRRSFPNVRWLLIPDGHFYYEEGFIHLGWGMLQHAISEDAEDGHQAVMTPFFKTSSLYLIPVTADEDRKAVFFLNEPGDWPICKVSVKDTSSVSPEGVEKMGRYKVKTLDAAVMKQCGSWLQGLVQQAP